MYKKYTSIIAALFLLSTFTSLSYGSGQVEVEPWKIYFPEDTFKTTPFSHTSLKIYQAGNQIIEKLYTARLEFATYESDSGTLRTLSMTLFTLGEISNQETCDEKSHGSTTIGKFPTKFGDQWVQMKVQCIVDKDLQMLAYIPYTLEDNFILNEIFRASNTVEFKGVNWLCCL